MNFEDLDKIDSKKMYQVYDEWPKIAETNYHIEHKEIELDEFDDIVFAGMGGSGVIGDIFSSILSRTSKYTSVIKGYHLPKTVNSKTLVVITSVSGNTIEALSILKKAREVGTNIISFSSGGMLQEICKKNNINHARIDMINSPRASLTAYLYNMLNILGEHLSIERGEIEISIKELKETARTNSYHNLTQSNFSLGLAKWITKTPIIYYPWGLHAVANRFKNSLQENAKMHAIAEDVIEASHNGIVAWEKQKKFQPILIQGENDFIKTKEVWKIIKTYFKNNDIDFREVYTKNTGILSKIINSIYLLDIVSIYKAVLLGIDVTPVKSISFIKSKLGREVL